MQNLHFTKRNPLLPALAASALLGLTACGSSSSPPASSSSPPASTGPTSSSAPGGAEPTTGAGAEAAIKANFTAFFDPKTPVARRIALLQNGQVFASVVRTLAGSSLAQLATARVDSVSLTGTTQAGVVYTILAGGTPALSGQHGIAIYQNGVWKVGDASVCGLLKLENGGKTTGPGYPAACKG